MSFKEFIGAYADGSIWSDTTWKAYCIEDMTSSKAYKKGMRLLGRMDTTALAVEQFVADYDLRSVNYATHLLGLWATWTSVALGERRTRLKLREKEDE
jgi:hypothetical protein